MGFKAASLLTEPLGLLSYCHSTWALHWKPCTLSSSIKTHMFSHDQASHVATHYLYTIYYILNILYIYYTHYSHSPPVDGDQIKLYLYSPFLQAMSQRDSHTPIELPLNRPKPSRKKVRCVTNKIYYYDYFGSGY